MDYKETELNVVLALILCNSFIVLISIVVFVARLAYVRWPLKFQLEEPSINVKDLMQNADTGDLILFAYPIKLSGMLLH